MTSLNGSFSNQQAVSLFPQRLETAIYGDAGNRSFCLLGSYPKPREQPRGRGWLGAFVSRTLLFLRPRKRRSLRSPAKRKTGNPVLAAIIGLRQDWQGIVWTIPKSHPGVSANLQCPPHRCSRFRSPALRTGSDYRSIAGA